MKLSPRQHAIASGTSGLARHKVAAYRERWAVRGAELPECDWSQVPETGSGTVKPSRDARTAGVGTNLSATFARRGVPSCEACKLLAAKMDEWGPNGCRERMTEIVDELVARATGWERSELPWYQRLALKSPETWQRAGLERMVVAAIEKEERRVADRPRPRWITTQQLVADTLSLIPRLPSDLSAVVGVARSGLLPASIVATTLHLPLYSLDQEQGQLRGVGHGWRLRDQPRRNGPMLVIDDTTGSGRSLRMTQRALRPTVAADALTASVYCNPLSALTPDLWAVDLYLPHFLSWNFTNSIVGSVCAFDMDGVICHDAESGGEPGTPLYLPRRDPAHIITGRTERHREGTLRWLNRWGVRVASLTMKPDDDERGFVEYKAEAVRRFAATAHKRPFGPPTYIESCPRQARRIAELSGVLTVCPIVGEVYGPEGCWL